MNILIRVDGSNEIGTGHVMRTFSIAEELIDRGHRVVFCSCLLLETLSERILNIGCEIVKLDGLIAGEDDLTQTLDVAEEHNIDTIILDGYSFGSNYLSTLREKYQLIFIDDEIRLEQMHADVIINASPLATKEMYRNKITNSKLLLGVRFAMVRKEFQALSNKIKPIGQRKNILISFGGTDVLDLTIPVLNVLLKTFDADQVFDVVVKKGFSGKFPKNVMVHEDCNYMAMLMARSGLAISAGGSTLGELATLHVPTILTVVADNQLMHANWLKGQGNRYIIDARIKKTDKVATEISTMAFDLWMDSVQRQNIINSTVEVVDGKGTSRIIDEFL